MASQCKTKVCQVILFVLSNLWIFRKKKTLCSKYLLILLVGCKYVCSASYVNVYSAHVSVTL